MTAPYPDLRPAQEVLGRLMVDGCVIWDGEGELDAALLDPVTHALVLPDDWPTLYAGKALFGGGSAGQQADAGHQALTVVRYHVLLPYDAPGPFAAGNMVLATASARDNQLAGCLFTVTDVKTRTLNTTRRLELERREV